ncbi:serine palmitoyltransferase component [Ophidiomyces ophidiicola]|uniref:Serine palmitoyltransferase component n=1 Tax=Ophidiomyces ophidiicola TaxID=1387563 RepID=A0ACB8URV4_9EURO|nr:serine palmitoyltransferase component [Ophidiomyces ophidiicola]KAI1908082.1 serine palmitoyltransferase component [Ophidiomyces ophidiicola]KAI1911854.1 serine palmitoyltransferase component [Ophidiomyces ophidiicola]KAI1923482.1 serine palmitoyltransferase component [Ophidiomyces ophidiicola]KAI1943015.1 serine palmitoyltransferase component [Ophidiomyces ophidiicola]KAI1950178.1 serine palmitoyltransferase component [Ophidiomyces ophidiicola]
MPRQPTSNIASNSPNSSRPTNPNRNRFSQLFLSSPKPKQETSSNQLLSGGLDHSAANTPLSSMSLPTIEATSVDDPTTTTLFQPPSPQEARRLAKQHAQFGPLGHPSHRYTSRHQGGPFPDPVMDEPPYFYLFTTYISYLLLIACGHIRDFFGKRFKERHYRHLKPQNGFGALYSDFDSFYVRRLKLRINDCFERPTTGVPGRYITLIDRVSDDFNGHFRFTGTTTDTLNMSSYNYLGFAQSEGPCADAVEQTIKKYGISSVSTRVDAGTQDLHVEVEDSVAKFVGKEASMVFSMGFGTNAGIFPCLVSKGCLIISDELNHASIRFGARLSGASIEMFKHNDVHALEKKLREVISQGQPRTHRPWKKVLVVVEGLYSMEGSMCNLPGILALKKKYKFHLFIDEAHSIGAIGPRGRGICDYFGIDTSEVDILMGTLTKSFGANGGYIAADKIIIDRLRASNAAVFFGEAPTPPILAQISTSLRIISGELVPGQGEERLQRLAFNSRYLRLGLKRLGFIVYGNDDSPIIPLLLFHPAKMPAFSHEMLRRKISVVVVGYPATPLVSSRARFCVSAAHTKEDLDRLLSACDEIGNVLQLKFSSGVAGGALPPPDGVSPEMENDWYRKQATTGQITPPRWRYEDVVRRGVQDVKRPLR